MKIFILNPFISGKQLINIRKRQPLSLAYIASLLLNDKHQVKLLDASILGYKTKTTLQEIEKFSPDILILTSSSIDRWECPNLCIDSVFEIINKTKVKPIVLTGSHGSTISEWVFSKCKVDYIVRGEPEMVVLNLIRSLIKNIDVKNIHGISFRQNNMIIHNPEASRIENLDILPLPAYNLLSMDKYSNSGFKNPFSIMMTSRGCPFNCSFCLKTMSAGKYIVRSPLNVVKEVEYLVDKFGVKSIFFQDWEFLIIPQRVEEISNLILEKGLEISWSCNARATDIVKNKNLISKMKRSGCFKINIGLESASDKILGNINKKVKKQDLQNAIDILKAQKIDIGFYVLLNCPGEDRKTIRETVDFIIANNLKVKSFNPVIPYPGTVLFDELRIQYPNRNFDWGNVKDYAGRIKTEMTVNKAQFYLRHYKFRKIYGDFYFLNPKWWEIILKRLF